MNATPKSPWSQLLQRLDPMAPIDLGITAKGASINRAFDAQLQRAIWDKRYELPANDPRLAYRVFSKWENTLIAQLKDKGVLGGPRFVAMEQRASPMHSGATPMKDRDTGMSLLRTHDLGPDLDIWTRMRPCIQGAPKDHLLYRACDLLRLVRAILVALKDFNDHGFVHGDLHARNVALPCRETHRAGGNSPQGESVTVQPLWDELRIFDLDASLSRHSAPPVVPYLHTDPAVMPRMSNHLRLRLCMLHALAESGGQDNAYNEQFWARQTGWDLQCLQKVDWREDLHQLGHLLRGLLQTEQFTIEYDHPDQDFLLDKLADAFMAWGAPDQLDGLTTEELQQRSSESAHSYYQRLRGWVDRVEQLGTPAKPHTRYLAEIDAVLTKHPGTGSGVWVFRRDDNDRHSAMPTATEATAQGTKLEVGTGPWEKWADLGKTAWLIGAGMLLGFVFLTLVYQAIYKGLWENMLPPQWRQWTQGMSAPASKRQPVAHAQPMGTPIGRWDDQASSSTLALGKPLAQPFSELLNGPPMLAIPSTGPSGFQMGSDPTKLEPERGNDEHQHHVVIQYAFALSETEVTRQQYQACVDGGNCPKPHGPTHTWEHRDNSPVVNVSWDEAQRYVEWLNALAGLVRKDGTGRNVHPYRYRLPSESEWEYAARAGSRIGFGFPDGENISPNKASYDWTQSYDGSATRWGGILFINLRNDKPALVGSYDTNAWGLKDMHGNVAEWVQDCYEEDYDMVPADGLPHGDGNKPCNRVVRGGAWDSSPAQLRFASRSKNSNHWNSPSIGFRVAKTLAPLRD